jgi:hypothetical protein
MRLAETSGWLAFPLEKNVLRVGHVKPKKIRRTFFYCLDELKGEKVYLGKFSSPLSWPQAAWISMPLLSRKVTVGHRG